jgi:uncharacterized membrane protein YkoI
MKNLTKSTIVAGAFTGLLFSGVAMADKDELRLLEQTKISLTEAIAIAEKHQGGRAYEASLDDDRFSPEYEVDVAVDNVSYELTVDGISGEVTKVKGGKQPK